MRDSCDLRATPVAADPSIRRTTLAANGQVLEGAIPPPMLSSRTRCWKGTVVELLRYDGLDALVGAADHEVAVHLAGNVTLQRSRCGRSCTRTMIPGDVTITPSGSPVRWRQAGESVVVVVRLEAGYVAEVAARECEVDPAQIVIQPAFGARDPKLEQFAMRLIGALELEANAGRICADTASRELAIHIVRQYSGMTAARRDSALPTLSPHKLRRVEQYVNDNPLTLAAMAGVVALSPGHFAHAFRHAKGVSPHRYVLQTRIDLAKQLLLHSDLSITDIADAIGCSSHSHFSVLFRRIAGVSPRDFRRRG